VGIMMANYWEPRIIFFVTGKRQIFWKGIWN